MKQIYIDTETSGLDPYKNGIWQIAGMVVVGNHAEPFDFKVRPFETDEISPMALEMSKMTEQEMRSLEKPEVVHKQLTALMGRFVDKYDKNDKFIFYGYNAKFDADMLRAWFGKCGDKYYGSWFYSPPVDIMATAAFHLAEKRHELKDFKLETVVEYLGLKAEEEGEFHSADVDILYTYLLAEYLRKHYPKREL
jgi:DNA polymerase III subunit epsilon